MITTLPGWYGLVTALCSSVVTTLPGWYGLVTALCSSVVTTLPDWDGLVTALCSSVVTTLPAIRTTVDSHCHRRRGLRHDRCLLPPLSSQTHRSHGVGNSTRVGFLRVYFETVSVLGSDNTSSGATYYRTQGSVT